MRQDKPKPVFAATCVVLKEGTTVRPKYHVELDQQKSREHKNQKSRGKNMTSSSSSSQSAELIALLQSMPDKDIYMSF